VPDVVGLDFYTAGIRLQQAGFTVEKESDYDPQMEKNNVFQQEPEAGSALPVGESVTIYIATESKIMFSTPVTSTDSVSYWNVPFVEFSIDLPASTECELTLVNIAEQDGKDHDFYARLYHPEGWVISYISGYKLVDRTFVPISYQNIFSTFHQDVSYKLEYGSVNMSGDLIIACKPDQ